MQRLSTAFALVALLACAAKANVSPPAGKERLQVKVDHRVELLSLLYRLNNFTPYSNAYETPYRQAMDAAFAKWKDHDAVKLTKVLHDKYAIGFNAPQCLAVYLDDSLNLLVKMSPLPQGVDDRWKNVPNDFTDAYVAALRAFVKDTDFDKVLAAQAPYTSKVEQRFKDFLADKPMIDWFDAVLGKREKATYTVIPGLLTGSWNFGLDAALPGGSEAIDQVMFLEKPDASGMPSPGELTWGTLAHEIAHTYVNPVMDASMDSLKDVAEPVFASAREQMIKDSYTTYPNMVRESVVRAIAVLYLQEKVGYAAANRSLAEQKQLGFAWVKELATQLDGVRQRNGGKISNQDMVDTTRKVFAAWKPASAP